MQYNQIGDGEIRDKIMNMLPGIIIGGDDESPDMGQGMKGVLSGDDSPVGKVRRKAGLPVLVDELNK